MFSLTAHRLTDPCPTLIDSLQGIVTFAEDALDKEIATHEVEQGWLTRLLALGHDLLEAFFAASGDGDVGDHLELEDGRILKRLAPRPRAYRSLFGEFEIHRMVYAQREGQRIEAIPLDARLKLPEVCPSYLLQSWNEQLMVDLPYAHANALLERLLGLRQSVQTLERQQEALSTAVTAFWEQHPAPPPDEEGAIIVNTVDGKGGAMRASETDGQRGKKKIALLGSVDTIDRNERTPDEVLEALFADASTPHEKPSTARPKPRHKQIRACLARDEQGTTEPQTTAIFEWMAQQNAQRNPDDSKPSGVLIDGQTSLWDAAWTFLPGDEVAEILDIIHVSEYLWDAGELLYTNKQQIRAWVKTALGDILHGHVSKVIKRIKRQGVRLRGDQRKRLGSIQTYLLNNNHRMNYDVYLAAGFPIATGVIEGACRHLVKDRMERSGMRWTVRGAQALLQLRSVTLSALWEPFMAFYVDQELTHLYGKQAANDDNAGLAMAA